MMLQGVFGKDTAEENRCQSDPVRGKSTVRYGTKVSLGNTHGTVLQSVVPVLPVVELTCPTNNMKYESQRIVYVGA